MNHQSDLVIEMMIKIFYEEQNGEKMVVLIDFAAFDWFWLVFTCFY